MSFCFLHFDFFISKRRKRAGMTLMELLIVVSLLLIIITAGFTNYITQVKRSRDARRKADLEQIRAALEMYRADNGQYVSAVAWIRITGSDALSTALQGGNYISAVPVDPIDNASDNSDPCTDETIYRYNYISVDSGQGYVLTAIMNIEESSDNSPCDSLSNWSASWCGPPGGFPCRDYCYGVQNP